MYILLVETTTVDNRNIGILEQQVSAKQYLLCFSVTLKKNFGQASELCCLTSVTAQSTKAMTVKRTKKKKSALITVNFYEFTLRFLSEQREKNNYFSLCFEVLKNVHLKSLF